MSQHLAAGRSSEEGMPTTLLRGMSLDDRTQDNTQSGLRERNDEDEGTHHIDTKPPLVTSNSAPPVLQTDFEGIREGFTFGTCPSSSFVGTPAAEMGPFEYPDLAQSGSSSRRSSIAQPGMRRGSSSSSTISTVTALSSATRRPSLALSSFQSAPAPLHDGPSSRRRGSMFHFQTKPVSAPIPPSLLARRGSLPAAEAIFGVPYHERRSHARTSLSGSTPIPSSPPAPQAQQRDHPNSPPPRRPSFRLQIPPAISARRGSLPVSPSQPIFPPTSAAHETSSIYPHRQSTSTNSSRGSLLSHSSLSTEDVIKDDDESTDQDVGVEVGTPGSVSETESMGHFVNPWAPGEAKEDERIGVRADPLISA